VLPGHFQGGRITGLDILTQGGQAEGAVHRGVVDYLLALQTIGVRVRPFSRPTHIGGRNQAQGG
jgi:hypothetical protein